MFGPILITENEFPDSKNLKVKLEVKLFGKKYRGRIAWILEKILLVNPHVPTKVFLIFNGPENYNFLYSYINASTVQGVAILTF